MTEHSATAFFRMTGAVLAGANGDLPSGLTFSHREHADGHVVLAHPDDRRDVSVGSLSWFKHKRPGPEDGWCKTCDDEYPDGHHSHPAGEVEGVQVLPSYRRRGIASALWSYAHSLDVTPKPVHSADQTDDGAAWAQHSATVHFRAAAASNGWHQDPGHAHVSRGMEIEPDGGWHPDVAHRILNGTATHDDVLGHVDTDHVGHYWSTHSTTDPGSLREPRSYAEPHEPISNWTPHAEPGENVLGAAGVVLVGHRPHGWNPDDNPDDGLMGNSHLPDHSHIPLHEIHYTGDGENWHTLTPPAGTTVHTDGQHHTATAHDGTLHIGYVGLHDYDKAINRLSSLTDFFREASLQETASMDDEHLDLYHRTTPEAAAAIYRDKRMTSKERIGNDRPVFFSTFRGDEEDAQGRGYGEGVVHVRVPHEIANIDDEFPSGEEHYWVHAGHLKPEHFVEPTHHTATLQATAAEQQFLQRQAAAVLHDKGVMVALVPPREVAEQLAREDGQPADQLHVTLAYLGNTSDYTREQLQLLPQIVGAWAVRRKPVHVRIGGIGTFNNAFKGEHVLWAAADIPDGAQMHSSLAHYLEGHGYRLPSEHGWTPHLTLAYVDRHHRFMPRLDEHHWDAEEVVTFIGGTRHPARLFGRPSTPATL